MTAANSIFALINEAVKNRGSEPDKYAPVWRLIRDYYIKPYPVLFPICLALSSLRGLNGVIYSYAISLIAWWIIDAKISPEDQLIRLGILAAVLIPMEIIRYFISLWTGIVTVTIGQKMVYRMRHRVNNKLHAMNMSYHNKHAPGRLMTHLFSDLQKMMTFMTSCSRFGVSILGMVIVGMVLIFVKDWMLGLIVAASFPLLALGYSSLRKQLSAVNAAMRKAEGSLNGLIGNRVPAFEVIKAFGQERREAILYAKGAMPVLRYGVASSVLTSILGSFSAIIGALLMGIAVWITGTRVMNGTMDVSEVVFYVIIIGFIYQPVQWLVGLAGEFHTFHISTTRIYNVLDTPDAKSLRKAGELEPPKNPTSLSFQNVRFAYNDSEEPVLKDVTFELPVGKRLCVMGASGAGKSTLARLVMRLYDPEKGAICLGEHDLREYDVDALREAVGFAAQEATIFAGTVARNIAYQPEPATFDQVVTGATQAQIHDDIERLPSSYHTLTQERGFSLSGGQKQRVNLARAFAADRPILIIDDTTSALDADTEAALIETLHTALAERTAMIISHRVSVAMACDYVLMLDEGKVAQFGDARELAIQEGLFQKLFATQQAHIEGE